MNLPFERFTVIASIPYNITSLYYLARNSHVTELLLSIQNTAKFCNCKETSARTFVSFWRKWDSSSRISWKFTDSKLLSRVSLFYSKKNVIIIRRDEINIRIINSRKNIWRKITFISNQTHKRNIKSQKLNRSKEKPSVKGGND